MAATTYLIAALAATFAVAASVWVGGLARDIVLQQHARRLALEADQTGANVSQAIAVRLGAMRVAESRLYYPVQATGSFDLRQVFEQLLAAYPDLDWLAVAGTDGTIAEARVEALVGSSALREPWFQGGRSGPWVGQVDSLDQDAPPLSGPAPALGYLAAPIRDAAGVVAGVIVTRLSWRWSANHLQRLNEAVGASGSAAPVLLARNGLVLVGPAAWRGQPWAGTPLSADRGAQRVLGGAAVGAPDKSPRFERLPDGETVLVARSPVTASGNPQQIDYEVQLSEPNERVFERADGLARQIFWVSMFLGAATAAAGAFGAGRLTRRLRRLTESVVAAGGRHGGSLVVPAGCDEVTKLGTAFAELLHELQKERGELRALGEDLERRVVARTIEVQRLAEEARYAAVVRERLKIARDMHDTLAHSMMAMLSEIRLLRRMHLRDPDAFAAELARAEQVAHDGLSEARKAISQMRVNPVRDTGLGTALHNAVITFTNNTGIAVDYRADPQVASVGDERAETVLNMAREVLRNVERHAGATRVIVTLLDVGEVVVS